MSARRLALPAFMIGLALVAWYWGAPTNDDPTPAEASTSRRPREGPAVELPPGVARPRFAAADVRPVPERREGAGTGSLQLPDGSFVSALNGVRSSDRVRWSGGPFPEIAGVIRNPADGVDWYVLANGDVLTTVNAEGTRNGVAVRRDLILHVQRRDLLPVVK